MKVFANQKTCEECKELADLWDNLDGLGIAERNLLNKLTLVHLACHDPVDTGQKLPQSKEL